MNINTDRRKSYSEDDSFRRKKEEDGEESDPISEQSEDEDVQQRLRNERMADLREPLTPSNCFLTVNVPLIDDDDDSSVDEFSDPKDWDFTRKIAWGEKDLSKESMDVGELLHDCLMMRNRVLPVMFPWDKSDPAKHPIGSGKLPPEDVHLRMSNGILEIEGFEPLVSYSQHYKDFKKMKKLLYFAPAKSFCYYRLNMLELKFNLYKNLYSKDEIKSQHQSPRDFYNCRKVDNHVHLSSAMNQRHLLSFMKRKLNESPDDVVLEKNGKSQTLQDVFSSLNLTAESLSVDSLEVHAGGGDVQHRFDMFTTSKYNPFGLPELREVFLKTDNVIKGRYFAEICSELFSEIDRNRYTFSEPRVSIYGRAMGEWKNLSAWVIDNELNKFENVRWMIQIPRLFHLHKSKGMVRSFQEMLENIFLPIFEATVNPEAHPKIAEFLKHIVAFDHVDDESKSEGRFHSRLPMPHVWNTKDNPPYAYYNYFLWANLNVLNQLREAKGLNTFQFRPHSGEAGDQSHLISAFLTADSIAHGINLRKTPLLQYLFYLARVGISVSPLSNNHLFLNYGKNPFPNFFNRGLNVCLSSDDPLIFHFTRDPLLEEYSCAAQVFHLSNADLCEIARTSVLQSGLSHEEKAQWISPYYYRSGAISNDVIATNVPQIRIQFRHDTLLEEHLNIQKLLHSRYFEDSLKNPSTLTTKRLFQLMNKLTTTVNTQQPDAIKYKVRTPTRPVTPWIKVEPIKKPNSVIPKKKRSIPNVFKGLDSFVTSIGYFSLGLFAYQIYSKILAQWTKNNK